MKKRIFAFALALALCMMLSLSASAAPEDYFAEDYAGLLTSSEAAVLGEELQQISENYNIQLTVITLESLEGGDIDEWIAYIYEELELGCGEYDGGVLLLVSMDPRKMQILARGASAERITNSVIEGIFDEMQYDMSAGNYAAAFDTFANQCEYYLQGNTAPFDFGQNLVIALVIGLVVALIVVLILKGQLKSVHAQERADMYVKPGSMQLTQAGDFFMYRNVTRREKPKNNSSSGSGSSSGNAGGRSF